MPASAVTTTASPTTTAPTTTAAPTATYTYAPPAPARAITAREWALIAKNPDAHIGERIIVHGEVTRFDSGTGDSAFRANVDGVVHKVKYGYADYETNTLLAGTSSDLAEVVADDLFTAETTVTGSLTYDTSIGGGAAVPQLLITKITITGSTA